jgi:hypothetical protein
VAAGEPLGSQHVLLGILSADADAARTTSFCSARPTVTDVHAGVAVVGVHHDGRTVGAAAVADRQRRRVRCRLEEPGAVAGKLADVDGVAGSRAVHRRVEGHEAPTEPVR